MVNRTFDLFAHLGASDDQLDFPIVYTSALQGTASLDPEKPGVDIAPLLDTILEKIPPPAIGQDRPLQLLVLALAHDPYKGKMGIGKLLSGTLTKRQALVRIKTDGTQIPGKATDLLVFEGLERKEVAQVEAGQIVVGAGFPEIRIGPTPGRPAETIPVPPLAIDEPTAQMTFLVNTSPLAGPGGKYGPFPHPRARL